MKLSFSFLAVANLNTTLKICLTDDQTIATGVIYVQNVFNMVRELLKNLRVYIGVDLPK